MPTILVADDNSNIQKMVSLVFKEKGIRVVAVGNGEAACRKVPEVRPDVVLADVFMPVRNGYEVCEFVKQDPEFANTPVILLVGAFDPLDEKEARRVGANGVLKKPFVPPEPLIAMVSALLGKLEPPVEEAPPVAEVAAPPPPPTPAVYAPPVREFSPAPESADSDTGDETVLAFGDPVATPSAKSRETDEEEDDDSEPASEWARRRATVDYEIDSADSANMVEKLAAEGAAADAEILASRKHLPFGGANVPEGVSEATPEPSPVKWPHFVAPETTADEPLSAKPEQPLPTEETAAPTAVESPATGSWGNELPPEPDLERAEEPSLPSTVDKAPFQEPELAPSHETVVPWSADPPPESVAHSDDAIREVASAAWPLPQIPQEPEAKFTEPDAAPPDESHEPDVAPSFSENQPVWHETVERMSDPPLALPEVTSYLAPEETESAQTKFLAVEPPANESPSRLQVDQATVDDMVAKVLSKLEPQLHQALANGVLRPLVEELLNQERDKK